MNNTSPDSKNLLVTHAVLGGLTPLIPVPLVDDLFYGYFLRSLVQKLADLHGKNLSTEQVKILASQPKSGCALGCIGSLLLYPIKKVLRKIFFFLELKRATDVISHTYYQGFLLYAAIKNGAVQKHGAAKVRAAIDAVLARTNTSPLSQVVAGAVKGSKGALQRSGRLLTGSLPGTGASEKEVAQVAASVEERENELLGGLMNQLQQLIAALPDEHFEKLQQEFERELTSHSSQ